MNKNRNIIAALGIMCLATAGCIIFTVLARQDADALLKLAIYYDSGRHTFYIVLYENGVIRGSYGTRNHLDISADDFMRRTRKSSKRALDDEEMAKLQSLLNGFLSSPDADYQMDFSGGLSVELLHSERVFRHLYEIPADWELESRPFRKLVDELIRLSPIPIDLHNFH